MDLVRIVVAVILAALAYYILVPVAHLPAIIGIVVAVLIILVAFLPYLKTRV